VISVIDLPRPIDEDLAADIEKESAFVSRHLRRLQVRGARDAIEVEIDDQAHGCEVRGKVDRFLEAMLKRTHKFETKVFHRSERRDEQPFEANVHEQLRQRGWIFDYSQGHVALSGPVLALARLIDSEAAELYRCHFGASAMSFPAFIDAEILRRCGYFDSHPNAVSFVGHVVEDFDALEAFRHANSCADHSILPPSEQVRLPGLCLNPAACFPCYPALRGQHVGGKALTWQGRVFRYESRNLAGLDRLWEFNVRELVFVGSEEYVAECRQRALPLIGELAAMLDLECTIETANDPFFATVAAARSFWQRAQEVKNEIMLPIERQADGKSRRLACGSINLHGGFFCDRFGIKTDGGTSAVTGCIGLGIERWVFAAFAQHGFEPERWPGRVRDQIFG
jgi:seryl-tRNA synthetase